jgi:hypothetical protein
MLSACPSISQGEFDDACRVVTEAWSSKLDGSGWLALKWQQGVFSIRKAYPVGTKHRGIRKDDTNVTAAEIQDEEGEVNEGEDGVCVYKSFTECTLIVMTRRRSRDQPSLASKAVS